MPSPRGTNYDRLLEGIRMDDDGLPMRPVKAWTPDKLALLSYYLQGFAKACVKAGGWYFLDGFAGDGANNAGQLGRFKGSALIGAMMAPPATKVVLIEKGRKNVRTLKTRCARVRPDAMVIEGDCNARIGEALGHFADRWLPGFCVLDPEGLELGWEVIEACAAHRQHGTPYELLIYFSTPGMMRTAAVTDPRMIEGDERALRRLFGNEEWRSIAERQRAGALDGRKAGTEYLSLYEGQLQKLGYRHVMSRAAIAHDRRLIYHLVFASDKDAGRNIMRDTHERAYASQLPLQEPPASRPTAARRARGPRAPSPRAAPPRRAPPTA